MHGCISNVVPYVRRGILRLTLPFTFCLIYIVHYRGVMLSLLKNSHSSSQLMTQSFVLLLVSVAALTDASLYPHSKQLLAVYVTGDTSKLGQFASQGKFQKVLPLAGIIATFLTGTITEARAGNPLGR